MFVHVVGQRAETQQELEGASERAHTPARTQCPAKRKVKKKILELPLAVESLQNVMSSSLAHGTPLRQVS